MYNVCRMQIQVAASEVYDKSTISTLKLQAATGRDAVRTRLDCEALRRLCDVSLKSRTLSLNLYDALLEVNTALWKLEDAVRDPQNGVNLLIWSMLARCIFRFNETRSWLKRLVDEQWVGGDGGCDLMEVKVRKSRVDSVGLVSHMGAGDMLVIAGAVRFLCSRHRSVTLVHRALYGTTARFMFRDLTNLTLVTEEGAASAEPTDVVLCLGQHSETPYWSLLGDNWCQSLYLQAGIPPSVRYSCFRVDRDREREQALYDRLVGTGEIPYIFVHRDLDRSFDVNLTGWNPSSLRVVYPGDVTDRKGSNNLFDFCSVIERAASVHVIDSCFAHLTDILSLNTNAYLHVYSKGHAGCHKVFAPFWHKVFSS